MDYYKIVYILTILTHALTSRTRAISHHVRAISQSDYNAPSQITPEKLRWEIGLREATYQTLIRENIHQHNLKNDIYSAPILGYQESAVPFGDIAILARGQLYNTPNGFKFVQDPYRNDCDDCHTDAYRCNRGNCAQYRDQNSKSLMALWTVKRIRHREGKVGHRYELQFTVSPMSPVATAQFVTRNGNFDYNIPGHVFVIKVKNREMPMRERNDYGRGEKFGEKHTNIRFWPPNQDRFTPPSTTTNFNDFTPNVFNLNTGEYYSRPKLPESDPNHTGYLIGIASDYKPQETHESQERPFISKQLYTRTHEKIQKEPVKHLHHHFYIPEVSDIDIDANSQKEMTKKNQYLTSVKPVMTSDVHKFILTTSDVNQPILTQTTQKLPKDYMYQNYKDSTAPIPIVFHPSTNFQTVPTLTSLPNNIQTIFKLIPITIPNPTEATPFQPSPYLIRFSEPDPTYSNNQPPTVGGYISSPVNPTETTKYTLQAGTKSSTVKIYHPEKNEQATTQTIKSERLKYPDSINAQLPPPRRGSDTTIPYISSTISVIPNSESGTNNNKIQLSTPSYDSTTADYYISTQNDEGTTEYITTTPPTTIQKPLNYSKRPEIKHNNQKTTPFLTTPFLTEITTLRSSTTSRRYLNRKRPTYVDDLDIFANNNLPSTTKESVETTTDKYSSKEELITISSENFSPSTNADTTSTETTSTETTSTAKNTRLHKYLKYNRNRNNNRYNRTYNSKRLRARNFTKPEPEDVETKTSQSLITSISFQVNKNRKSLSDFSRPAILPASTDRPRSYLHKKDSEELTTDYPETTTYTDQTKAFNEFAQTLVNHAKVVTYLEKTTTPVYTTTNSH